jgi:ABC-2 type transport system permease protein
MSPVLQVAAREMQAVGRSRGGCGLALLLLALLGFCLLAGRAEYRQAAASRAQARQVMRAFFLGQGAANPHSAVHYGTYVFRPYSVLSVVDPGITPFVGTTLRLEGHAQNQVQFAPSERSSSLLRFGPLSLTLLWQVVLPLGLLFLAHDTVVRERQAGTLRLLAAQGVSLRQVLGGKLLGYGLLALGALALSGAAVLLAAGPPTAEARVADLGPRLGVLLGCYALYYLLLLALTVYASARLASPSQVLVTLLAGWVALTVLLPKLAVSAGGQAAPLLSRQQFDEQVEAAYQRGINGHDPTNARTQHLQDSLLTHYKVKEVSQLPINADGILMQADEDYRGRAYDQQLATVQQQLARQNQLAARVALLDPLLAVRHLSRGLAQTDLAQHLGFVRQAETYRRQLIRTLNYKMAYGGSKSGDYDWQVSADYWRTLPDFQYQPPALAASLRPYRAELLALLGWVAAALGGLYWAAGRLRV